MRREQDEMDALVDTSTATSWCVSRRCGGSAADIAEYLVARLGHDPAVIAERGRLTVASGRPGAVATVGPIRAHRAKLAFAAWRRSARVTIEVTPWSRTESELLLRPTRRPPLGGESYYAAALAVLEALAIEVDMSLALESDIASGERLRRAS
jgi:hypothetical protein